MGNENKFIEIWDKFIESAFVTKDVETMMKLMTEDTIVVSIAFSSFLLFPIFF